MSARSWHTLQYAGSRTRSHHSRYRRRGSGSEDGASPPPSPELSPAPPARGGSGSISRAAPGGGQPIGPMNSEPSWVRAQPVRAEEPAREEPGVVVPAEAIEIADMALEGGALHPVGAVGEEAADDERAGLVPGVRGPGLKPAELLDDSQVLAAPVAHRCPPRRTSGVTRSRRIGDESSTLCCFAEALDSAMMPPITRTAA